MTSQADRRAVLEEDIRMARLRRVVDITAFWLGHASFSHDEALSIIEHARGEVLRLCPDKESVFDLVLQPRFLRILNERALADWNLADAMN